MQWSGSVSASSAWLETGEVRTDVVFHWHICVSNSVIVLVDVLTNIFLAVRVSIYSREFHGGTHQAVELMINVFGRC